MKEFIKKYKKNFILVFIIGFGIYFYILFRHDVVEVANKIKQININYIFVVFALLLAYVALEALVIFKFANEKVKGVSYLDAFRLNLSTQFFNSITPFAAGGQPFQVLYLSARGIKAKDSTSIILMNFITYNISVIIVGLLSLILKFNYFNNIIEGIEFKYFLLIGFGVNVFITVLTFVLAFSRRIYHIIIEVIWIKVIRWPLLKKFKLERKTEKIKIAINEFNHEIKELNKHKRLWIQGVLYHVIRNILFFMIPLFIFIALGENVSGNEINLVVGVVFVMMVMSYFPLPGGSGGAELFFTLIFGAFFINSVIVAGVLLWRFITYYLYLLLGFIALITLNYKKNLDNINYPKDDLAVEETL